MERYNNDKGGYFPPSSGEYGSGGAGGGATTATGSTDPGYYSKGSAASAAADPQRQQLAPTSMGTASSSGETVGGETGQEVSEFHAGVGGSGDRESPYRDFWKLFLKNWHATITYCAVFWSFGMCVAFLGPTLLDLGCMTSSDMQTISWVFFAQLLCSLIGASLAGYIVQR